MDKKEKKVKEKATIKRGVRGHAVNKQIRNTKW